MNNKQISGWVILDKSAGTSSRYAGGKIARMFGTKKFGHLGTLDPFATGVLPIALGHATKMIPFLDNVARTPEKEYSFQIKWGTKTDTDDITGRPIDENDLRPQFDQITGVLPQLIGNIMQTPPSYSAIHIDGVRAYELARRGKTVEIPKRQVIIDGLEIIETAGDIDDIWYHVKCSTGTYVRSLSQDIAHHISPNILCTTSAIRRTRTHGFELKNAVTLDFLENLYNNDPDLLQEYLHPIDFGLDDILVTKINGDAATLFQNGGRIVTKDNNVGYTRVYNNGQFLGIAESKNGVLHPKRILKD